eukprot:4335337-Amphidinium_carterae.1
MARRAEPMLVVADILQPPPTSTWQVVRLSLVGLPVLVHYSSSLQVFLNGTPAGHELEKLWVFWSSFPCPEVHMTQLTKLHDQ